MVAPADGRSSVKLIEDKLTKGMHLGQLSEA